MKKQKPIISNHPILFLKIILSIFLLFYFLLSANFAYSQSLVPNGKQWQNVGGKIVASGHQKFNNGWYAGASGLFWKNDEDRSKPASHTTEEVNKDITVIKGQVTVHGPGYLALFRRMKGGVSSILKLQGSDKPFWVADLGRQEWQYGGPDGNYSWRDYGIRDFDPSINNGGSVPEGKTLSFDVVISSNWSEAGSWRGYGAPKEVEYEFWYFPREGGGIIQYGEIAQIDDFDPGNIVGKVKSGSVFDETLNKWIKVGDDIKTDHYYITYNQNVTIVMDSEIFYTSTEIQLKENSKIKINYKSTTQKKGVFLYAGRLWSMIKGKNTNKNGYAVETLNSVAGVEGTEFEMAYDETTGKTTLSVFEGLVDFSCKNSSMPPMKVNAGITATFDKDCNPGLNTTDPSVNTASKAGWNSSGTGNSGKTFPPIADSHVYAYNYLGWNMTNWGKYNVLTAGYHPLGGEKRAYLKFDLSGMDPNTVNSATLKLYYNGLGGSNALDLGIYRVLSPWIEGRGNYNPASAALPGELTWVNQPVIDQYPMVKFNPGTNPARWIEVDITSMVKDWLAGVPNEGMVIKCIENLSGRPEAQYTFFAREFEDPEKRPFIVINDDHSGSSVIVPNAKAEIPSIAGEYEMSCIGSIIYKYHLTLNQSGNNLTGQMVRTNGNERTATLVGKISPDGSFTFTRSIGNWKQSYFGKVIEQSGQIILQIGGKFGNFGDERYDWNANAVNQYDNNPITANLPEITGVYDLDCIGTIYKYRLTLTRSGNNFSGEMIRSTGNEAPSKVEGRFSADGSFEFTRSIGNWKQSYLGKITKQSGGKATLLEGRFGDFGNEINNWNAVAK